MSISKSKKPNTSYYLGIDYGTSKIGLAIADSETRMAFAYGTLKNDKNLLRKIGEIIVKEKISTAVIGITKFSFEKSEKNIKTKVSDRRDLFIGALKRKYNIKVEEQEEMFTTRQAQRNLIEKGVKGIKKFDDQEAARIILQSWLDKQR